jgi:cytochrome c
MRTDFFLPGAGMVRRTFISAVIGSAVALSGGSVAAAEGDLARGAVIWTQQCAMCHAIGSADGPQDLGPNLTGILDRPVASVTGFENWSEAFRRLADAGAVWDEERLRAFLADPYRTVPGTRMGFGGLETASEVEHLMAWLGPASRGEIGAETGFRVAPEVLAIEGDAEWGEFLAAECATCHRRDGAADGIPSITGWDAPAFVTVMHAYRARVRPNETMQTVAARLSDDEIAALAAYFETLERRHD